MPASSGAGQPDGSPSAALGASPAARGVTGSTPKLEAPQPPADEGLADPDPSWSEASTCAGAQAASDASMSDMASSHGGSTPRPAAAEARREAAAPPVLPEVRARWSDLSDGLVVSSVLDESFEEPSVASPTGSPSKKNSRRSARRRRRREEAKLAEACELGGTLQFLADDAPGDDPAAAQGGSRHVVTLGDIGLDLGPSGRLACSGAVLSDDVAGTAAAGHAMPSGMLPGHAASAPDTAVHRPSISREGTA
mmetsp:Transcript_105224/g.329521  ORF Transcript_105224/g.329521 Transcript_105224/m.329521 type:complete len:252 (-) Transcript_105224:577-1332(-)